MKKLYKWLQPRLRLWSIYRELGFNPWRKPRKKRKERKGVYIGTLEAIPFVNDDAKRTLSDLFMRPGFMMRDYIFRGQHERYLAPFTALLVFYSVFTLIVAIVNPQASKSTFVNGLARGFEEATVMQDSTADPDMQARFNRVIKLMTTTVMITQLDLRPEFADTPWKESLAAIEGELRSKGIPLFLGNFLMMWLTLALLLRKRKLSGSGAAAASAYILCQYCIFMFLALLITWGSSFKLGVFLMGILLFIDYRQMFGVNNRDAFRLTLKTGLLYLGLLIAFYILLALALIGIAIINF